MERAELAGVVRAAVPGWPAGSGPRWSCTSSRTGPYAEVAAELDMTPKAAKSLLYRARQQLRESLAHTRAPG